MSAGFIYAPVDGRIVVLLLTQTDVTAGLHLQKQTNHASLSRPAEAVVKWLASSSVMGWLL